MTPARASLFAAPTLRKVHLHGALQDEFFPSHELVASTPAEAIRGLVAMVPGLRGALSGGSYRCIAGPRTVGARQLDLQELALPWLEGETDFHVVPVVAGAKGGGVKIVLGVAMLAVAVALPFAAPAFAGVSAGAGIGATLATGIGGSAALGGLGLTYGALAALGAITAIGGIAQAISKQSAAPAVAAATTAATQDSYLFTSLGNTTDEGGAVPLIYGGPVMVGSTVIGIGVNPSDTPVNGTSVVQPVAKYTYNGIETIVQGGGGSSSGGKGGSSSATTTTATEDPNTLRAKSTAFTIDLLGEGEIEGFADPVSPLKCVYLDQTPVQNANGTFNYTGVALDYRLGWPTQDYMPAFGTETPLNITGTEFTGRASAETAADYPYGHSFTTLINDLDADAVRVIIDFPSLSLLDVKTGSLHGNSVDVQISVRCTTGSDQSWHNIVSDTVTGKCTSTYERAYRVNMPGTGPWLLMVWRNKPAATTENENCTTSVSALIKINDEKYSYPNSAYCGLSFDAQSFSGSIPQRNFLVMGAKVGVPSNYDPVQHIYRTEMWDGTFVQLWTNNPAWIYLDLLVNQRRGLGDTITLGQVDIYGLYTIAQYCDARNARPYNTQGDFGPNGVHGVPDGAGGFEPRFTFNGAITDANEAYNVLQSLAAVFQGMSYWGTGTIALAQDCPKDAVQIVAPANVVNGQFEYSSSALRDRHSVCTVTWNDPTQFYAQVPESVDHPDALLRYGYKQTSIVAFGCTKRSEARRLGKWLLDTEFNETDTVTYSCGLDHLLSKPGDIIDLTDPSTVGASMGGRVVGGNTWGVQLDRTVLLEGNDQFSFIDAAGHIVTRSVTYAPGPQALMLLTEELPSAAPIGAMWVLIGGIVKPRQFRVQTIRETADNTFEVTALQYDPTKFARVEFDTILPAPVYSLLSSGSINAPTGVSFHEGLYKANSGVVNTRLSISWEMAKDSSGNLDSRVTSYDIDYMNPTDRIETATIGGILIGVFGNWQRLGSSSTNGIEVDDITPGVFSFRVYSVSPLGRSLTPTVVTYTVLGKSAPPADVTNFQAVGQPAGITLSWDPVQDIDAVGYELREGGNWDGSDVLTTLFKGTSIYVPMGDADTHVFLIKAIDDSGNYSVNPAKVIGQVSAPDDVTVFVAQPQGDNVLLQWDPVLGSDVEYELRAGTTWDYGLYLARVGGTGYTVLHPGNGYEVFWIKAVSKLGRYSADAIFAEAILLNPAFRNIVLHLDFYGTGFPGVKRDMAVEATGSGVLAVNANTLVSANAFATSVWTKAGTVTDANAQGPDGGQTGTLFVEPSGSAGTVKGVTQSLILQGGITYSLQVDARAYAPSGGAKRYLVLTLAATDGSGFAVSSVFDLATSASVSGNAAAAQIAPAAYGYLQCGFANAVPTSGTYNASITLTESPTSDATGTIYTGDGISGMYWSLPVVRMVGQPCYGEYFSPIHLPASYRARNWVDDEFVALDTNNLTWSAAHFTWNSDDAAKTSWIASGDDVGAFARRVLALKLTAPLVDYLEGFSLADTLTGTAGTTGTVASGTLTYGDHYVGRGAVLSPGLRVSFMRSVTSSFATRCTIRRTKPVTPDAAHSVTLFELFAQSGDAAPRYRLSLHNDDTVVWEDVQTEAQTMTLTLPDYVAYNDYFTFAISQSATDRVLAIYEHRKQNFVSQDSEFASTASFGQFACESSASSTASVVLANIELFSAPVDLSKIQDFCAAGASPIGYDVFQDIKPGDYVYQDAVFGIMTGAPTGTGRPGMAALTLNIDVPDVNESGTATVAATWKTIPFQKTFTAVPSVVAYQAQGSVYHDGQVRNVTLTSFDAQLVDSGGNAVAGVLSYLAVGY